MDSRDVRNRRELKRVKWSVSLTAFAVIILILILVLTVRHTREKEMVRQFGVQQVTVARETAARLEQLMLLVKKNLMTLSGEPDAVLRDGRKIGAVHAGMEDKVSYTAVTDVDGTVIVQYPPDIGPRTVSFGNTRLFQQVMQTGKADVCVLPLPDMKGNIGRALALGTPRFRPGGEFGGMMLASFPLTAFDDDAPRLASETHSSWLLDGCGMFLFYPREEMIDRDAGSPDLYQDKELTRLREAVLTGQTGYGDYRLPVGGGPPERMIVSHAPIRFASKTWTIAIATPYDSVTAPVRKLFLNIMIGAAGLILVVIIAAAVIYSNRRKLHDREVHERLRERENWQDRLIREEKTIKGIIEGSPIPTFVLDRDHKIILYNKACSELTGYSAEEMIGTQNQYLPFYSDKRPTLADLIIDQDYKSIETYYGTKKIRRSLTVEAAYGATDFYQNLGGRSRHIYFLAAPIHDEKGEIIAAIETIQDVSREVQMSKELREYAETLQSELEQNINLRKEVESLYNYLQSIVDSLPDRLYVLSSDGTVHYMSRNVKEGMGLISQRGKGKHLLDSVDPELRDFMAARWEEAKRGIFTPYEIEVKARDGSKRTLLVSRGPIRRSDRYVIIQRDITDLKNLEERFYESQKMAAVGQLSAGIAHEVRNPLSSIKMSLQILEKRMHPTGNDLKRFEIAQREVEHLERLVNDVLIFARPATPRKEPSDIRKVIAQALALAEKGIADKKIQVHTCFSDVVPLLEIDVAMVEQAFLNLILNAVDAMGEGGVMTFLVEMADEDGPMLEVEITDDGCGIDEQDRIHLFNPFFTRKKFGTGLGLTQVKKIIDLHQGIVDIFSTKGEGTRVRVRFPLFADTSSLHAADGNGGALNRGEG